MVQLWGRERAERYLREVRGANLGDDSCFDDPDGECVVGGRVAEGFLQSLGMT